MRPRVRPVVWVAILAGGIVAMRWLCPDGTGETTGPHSDAHKKHGQDNAVWVESIYFRGHDPKNPERVLGKNDVEELAARLTSNGVRYAYVFAGPYDPEGGIPAYAFSATAQDSVRTLRALAPKLVLLPWLGGLQHRTVRLEDPRWVDKAIAETARLVETLDVPGVHLDFEFILPESDYVLKELGLAATTAGMAEYGARHIAFHKKLRERLPGAFISTVIPATAGAVASWKKKHSRREAAALAELADQISLLYYDTSIPDRETFAAGLVEQLQHIAGWKNRPASARAQCLIGAGTFINAPGLWKYRHLEVESLPNHFATLKQAIDAIQREKRLVDGTAIFCDWETSREEWEQFRQGWVNGAQ